jgi:phosphotriesterase-related protein
VPRYFSVRSESAAEEAFVREIEIGVGQTGVRAGIIKVASHEEVTPEQAIVLRAAARAAVRTGITVTTHTLPEARTGLRQLEILREEGLTPDRIVIGHSTCTDREYLELLYESGCTVGWDQFGTSEIGDETATLGLVVEFLAEGIAGRTVLSGDFGAFVDWDTSLGHSYRYVPEVVIPFLRANGVADRDSQARTVAAPARLLAPT